MTQCARLGITMGDPAGIGPEIVLKLFETQAPQSCLVYGDVDWLRSSAKRLDLPVEIVAVNDPKQSWPQNTVPVIQACAPLPAGLALGQVSANAGKAAFECIDRAIDDALKHNIAGIVTAPINKQAIHQAGIEFPGHTELLAHRCGNIPVAMMLVNQDIRVVLVTIHIALDQVSQSITLEAELGAIRLADHACRQMGIAKPRVAVAGLNPHAGEAGKFGHEELQFIEPAIELARREGIDASGPWPGDTVFGRARAGTFDVVVAQYHDQGLIPIKYLGIDQGVNITVGLPFVRTSVDHGTAFDIAAQGIANPGSLSEAVKLARVLVNTASQTS
jgi:4-hydroxythreonine-4-phosphate dehydrogenase